MSITIDGGAGITFPDTVQQTNGMTNTGGNPRYYAARAWVTFDGGGAVRAAVNVSSITDLGTGYFRIIFTTAMPDGNYVVAGTSGGNPISGAVILWVTDDDDVLPGSCEINTETDAGSAIDASYTSVAIFR
jgi:hypothetical protein